MNFKFWEESNTTPSFGDTLSGIQESFKVAIDKTSELISSIRSDNDSCEETIKVMRQRIDSNNAVMDKANKFCNKLSEILN